MKTARNSVKKTYLDADMKHLSGIIAGGQRNKVENFQTCNKSCIMAKKNKSFAIPTATETLKKKGMGIKVKALSNERCQAKPKQKPQALFKIHDFHSSR